MPRRKTILTVIIGCLILIALCISPPVRPYIKNRFLTPPLGSYTFRMYNSKAVKVADGELTVLEHKRAPTINYEWLECHLRVRGSGPNSETPSLTSDVSEYDIVGILQDGLVRFNLDPSIIDANNILEGKFENNSIRGKWMFSGYANYDPRGTFEAIRK